MDSVADLLALYGAEQCLLLPMLGSLLIEPSVMFVCVCESTKSLSPSIQCWRFFFSLMTKFSNDC